jgi:rSAM-partnered protein
VTGAIRLVMTDREGDGRNGDEWNRVDEPRTDDGREWEAFVRESEGPLRHVGSVSAPTAGVAREQATTLFGHAAEAIWLCPADEVERLTTRAFGAARESNDGDPEAGETGSDDDAGDEGEVVA